MISELAGLMPVSSLAGFIFLPAHQRVVLEAGADLVSKILFGLLGILWVWLFVIMFEWAH